jgi:hypothetical protein
MPITVTNFNTVSGYFELEDEKGKIVGTGKARVSRKPGMITLFFDKQARKNLEKGLRLPINWVAEIE